MTKLLLGVAASVAALLAIGAGSAAAITGGQADGDGHPYVGMVVTYGGSVKPELCSGTLVSPTIFLTAGHCTVHQAQAEIFFGKGPLDPSMKPDVTGTPLTPDWYAFVYRDLGVIQLATPVTMATYGELPELNQLDAMATQRGRQDQTFTTVGYGMQKSFPDPASWKDVYGFTRMDATPQLLQIDGGVVGDFGLLLSNNANTGGACFGDSGGPNFVGDTNVIAGVTVALANPTCAGTSTVFRLDQARSLDWLAGFGVYPPQSP